jgi:hypothetical protein
VKGEGRREKREEEIDEALVHDTFSVFTYR